MVDLSHAQQQIVFGNDSIVVQKHLADIPGGRSLDVTGVTDPYIKAGHVIITDGNGTYKPLSVSGEAYEALPESHTYAGILVSSVSTELPMASILTVGQVNSEALPYALPADFAAACPNIKFVKDEAAK